MTYDEILELTKDGVEIWKPIIGYEEYYEISNLGKVRSKSRDVKCGKGIRHIESQVKSIAINAAGYPCSTLSKNGKVVQIPIHRMLMEAFVEKPVWAEDVDHINTIKTDNSLSNLRWVTHRQNLNNQITLQHFKEAANSEELKQRILFSKKLNGGETAPITVFQYTKDGQFVAEYFSAWEAQRATGIYSTSIRRVLNDNTQAAGGYMWFTTLQENIKYERRLPRNTKPIIQCDTDNNIIKEWKSLTEASKELKMNIDMLSKSIKQNQPYKNFIFKYKD